MRTIKEQSNNINKRAVFGLPSATPLKDAENQVFEAVGAAVAEDVDKESGEIIEAGYIWTAEGAIHSTISPYAIVQIRELITLLDDGEKDLNVKVVMRKTKSDRTFITLVMV